jgi:hypothetical protein
MGLKITALRVPLNCIPSVPNLIKFYQAVGDTQADRYTGHLISLLSFFKSRLKIWFEMCTNFKEHDNSPATYMIYL